ncbi:major histocompatibility complex class I-related protein 1-like isoform X2 [Ranitomeya variabilis]|uniref:major histocompatibility complex class I-related protein 1-like isoform X2 n=1 Tax=Ranitomeya variabilis TaxID=490064 RepID=UPI004057C7AD
MAVYGLLLLYLWTGVLSDHHSLRYYYTGVSGPGYGIPEFSIVGYVDDQQIDLYSSDIGRNIPMASWMKKGDEHWSRETQIAKSSEALFRHDVRTAMSRFNQTEGFHIYQVMYGCERGDDGSITGYEQHGYDGREFLALDTKTWTFIPTMAQAQITTQRANHPDVQAGTISKHYLKDECISALEEYIEYGREDLERRVQPQVKVSGQEKGGAMKLHCQVYGFHPQAVYVKWMKNGEDEVHSYETTHVLPNPDGTYQIRVSAEVNPKKEDYYVCYVDHSSLEEPLLIQWEPIMSSFWEKIMIIFVLIVMAITVSFVGFLLYRKRKGLYKAPSGYTVEDSPIGKRQIKKLVLI